MFTANLSDIVAAICHFVKQSQRVYLRASCPCKGVIPQDQFQSIAKNDHK